MKSTNSNVREEDAIYFEHQESYKEFSSSLRRIWLNEIFYSQKRGIDDCEQIPEDYLDLLETIGKSLELLKLYVAAGITLCTEEGSKYQIPENILSDIRRQGFLLLLDAKTETEMKEAATKVSSSLKKAYREYGMANYSYLVKRAVETIHKYRYDKISASEIANKLEVDRTYLAKAFKKETSYTLTEYIRKVKMDLAAELMNVHSYSLSEVSELLSFSSYSYFSKQFKAYHSVAPEKY